MTANQQSEASSGPEGSDATPALDPHDLTEVTLLARGVASAVAPPSGLTDVQVQLLEALTRAMTGHALDYRSLDPLGPDELADVLAGQDPLRRQRVVQDMVLGELVLRPIPIAVAYRVSIYADALGVKDDFVRIARRYAQGAYGLAWMDLQHNGFVDHVRAAGGDEARAAGAGPGEMPAPFAMARPDPALAARWAAFEALPIGSLGRSVWEMYVGRGFALPGTPGGSLPYLAQHDFVHVLADYGTNLKGEVEVFAMIGRADPDPKGFAWLATLIGLFETGYITTTGFFDRDVRERSIQAPGMYSRLADALRRGKQVGERNGVDLFDIDYDELADHPLEDVRQRLSFPSKSAEAIEAGSVGLFELAGMSETQRRFSARRSGDQT